MATQQLDDLELRVDLAAAFRLAARFDMHEAVANHFSVATSRDANSFLVNPFWRHFALVRASELVVVDSRNEDTARGRIDKTAWVIHGAMHARLPYARCILHLHPTYATALSSLADPEIKPIDQATASFFHRVAIDKGYTGLATHSDEGNRLVDVLGDKRVLMMGNHGVLVVGESVADAFNTMYHLERACRTLMLAYATGRPLAILSDEVAEKTALGWLDDGEYARAHFSELKQILDKEDPSYAI